MKSLEKYCSEARKRAQRRKSPWNVALFLTILPLTAFWWFALLMIVLWIPHHGALSFREAAQHDIPMMFITLPFIVLAFVLAMISANFLFYHIPPARRAFDAEAGDNPNLHYGNAQKDLLKIAAVMAIVFIPIALIASWQIEPKQAPGTYSSKTVTDLPGNAHK